MLNCNELRANVNMFAYEIHGDLGGLEFCPPRVCVKAAIHDAK